MKETKIGSQIGRLLFTIFLIVGLICTVFFMMDFINSPKYHLKRTTERYSLLKQYFLDDKVTREYINHRSNSTTYSKVYWMIVDMLPIYAVKPYPESNLIYQNQFKSVLNHLTIEPINSATYIFYSEPPTMTVSRVYSLATGSPTNAVKLANSLEKGRIEEDSWLEQFSKRGYGIVHMGDLWWSQLFPSNFFLRKYSQSGYDSKGLDYLIMDNIDYEYAQNDWKMLVTHNNKLDLSVHSFGWNSKNTVDFIHLNDNNTEKALHKLPNDSLLLVFGDHGSRSRDGFHGGGSQEELESGMFAYSKSGFTFRKYLYPERLDDYEQKLFQLIKEEIDISEVNGEVFDQIGIVPTTASIFDVPIPYSNLGVIIPELMNYGNCKILECFYFLFFDHIINFLQIKLYVEEFVELNGNLHWQLQSLNKLFESIQPQIEFVKNSASQFIMEEKNLTWPLSNETKYKEVFKGIFQVILSLRQALNKNWKLFSMQWSTENYSYRLGSIILQFIGIAILSLVCFSLYFKSLNNEVNLNFNTTLHWLFWCLLIVGLGLSFGVSPLFFIGLLLLSFAIFGYLIFINLRLLLPIWRTCSSVFKFQDSLPVLSCIFLLALQAAIYSTRFFKNFVKISDFFCPSTIVVISILLFRKKEARRWDILGIMAGILLGLRRFDTEKIVSFDIWILSPLIPGILFLLSGFYLGRKKMDPNVRPVVKIGLLVLYILGFFSQMVYHYAEWDQLMMKTYTISIIIPRSIYLLMILQFLYIFSCFLFPKLLWKEIPTSQAARIGTRVVCMYLALIPALSIICSAYDMEIFCFILCTGYGLNYALREANLENSVIRYIFHAMLMLKMHFSSSHTLHIFGVTIARVFVGFPDFSLATNGPISFCEHTAMFSFSLPCTLR
eukprot:TRINITY_DN14656_c0_g1_i2.p1 TRINITY_DN14656_c0_g1~~TRINITY_DN14656_c0_g1_i2.p1  ORF type:complete len:891 (+),score=70.53 TRINITY_DN14656_c0_g1_i2:3-2675(+)